MTRAEELSLIEQFLRDHPTEKPPQWGDGMRWRGLPVNMSPPNHLPTLDMYDRRARLFGRAYSDRQQRGG